MEQTSVEKCKSDLVSIIIPAYNAGKTIKSSIQSALAQSNAEIEVIVINDGSTDDTASICQVMMQSDSRIKLVSQENGGVASARNKGIQSASGRYIAWIDADDTMEPDFCASMVSQLEETGADMAICGYKNIFPDHIDDVCPTKWEERKVYDIRMCLKDLVEKGLSHPLWNKLYVREKILHPFDETYKVGEDIKFTLEYLIDNNNICFVHKPKYNYQALVKNSLTYEEGSTLKGILLSYNLLTEASSALKIKPHLFDNYFIGFIFGYLRNLLWSNAHCEAGAKKRLLNIISVAKPTTPKKIVQKLVSLCILKIV